MNDKLTDRYMMNGHSMIELSKRFKSFIKSQLSEENLSFSEAITMLALLGCDGMPAERILKSVNYDKSVMTRTLQSLEDGKLVSRERNPEDGRSWIFTLTVAGQEKAEKVSNVMKQWSKIVYSGITKEEMNALDSVLEKMLINAERGDK